jgi:uracil-DNA glycosylase
VWDGDTQSSLFTGARVDSLPAQGDATRVPRAFYELAAPVLCHRSPLRHGLLYRIAFRIVQGERHLLDTQTDSDVHEANQLAQAVRRDAHKMKAFVRFRASAQDDNRFIAWFEPENFIVDRVAPFFVRRFTGMQWAILTPYRSALWDGQSLSFGRGASPSNAPAHDAQDSLWRAYYANIFNPARLNPRMMTKEMPQRYWKNLPEAHVLPELLASANRREYQMTTQAGTTPRRRIPVPAPAAATVSASDLSGLRDAARACRRCPLWQDATQTVFGEGPEHARIMIVGEQPGDREDLRGRPFVGPAGELLTRALAEAGIDRSLVYLTNVVKHFRFELRGKRRIHKSPDAQQIAACLTWLEAEIARIGPNIIVCLGATAAAAMFGRKFRLLEQRGRWSALESGVDAFATVHPSWVLRQPAGDEQERAFRGLVDDLKLLQQRTEGNT